MRQFYFAKPKMLLQFLFVATCLYAHSEPGASKKQSKTKSTKPEVIDFKKFPGVSFTYPSCWLRIQDNGPHSQEHPKSSEEDLGATLFRPKSECRKTNGGSWSLQTFIRNQISGQKIGTVEQDLQLNGTSAKFIEYLAPDTNFNQTTKRPSADDIGDHGWDFFFPCGSYFVDGHYADHLEKNERERVKLGQSPIPEHLKDFVATFKCKRKKEK